jgi:hypothetical protein
MTKPSQAAIDAAVAVAFRAAAKVLWPTKEARAETPEMMSQIFLNGVAYAANELLGKAAALEAGQ